jgi:phosphopantetheinyl transferase
MSNWCSCFLFSKGEITKNEPVCSEKVQSPEANTLQPMPFIRPFLTSTDPLALALTAQAPEEELNNWAQMQERFPNRTIETMALHRQLEHFTVDCILIQMGWSADRLQIIHDSNGKPRIQSPETELSTHNISISHCTVGEACSAMVALGRGEMGCDIENERDTLRRIAGRAFIPGEGHAESPLSKLAALWTVKESMYKAFGPSLDFREDLRVTLPHSFNAPDLTSWSCTASVRGRPYKWKIWKQNSPITSAPFWLCCGPLLAKSTEEN